MRQQESMQWAAVLLLLSLLHQGLTLLVMVVQQSLLVLLLHQMLVQVMAHACHCSCLYCVHVRARLAAAAPMLQAKRLLMHPLTHLLQLLQVRLCCVGAAVLLPYSQHTPLQKQALHVCCVGAAVLLPYYYSQHTPLQ